ncbi:MAG: putative quinol monooxygenase [Rhodoglobus sp.]
MRLLVEIEVQPGKAEEQMIAFRSLAPLVRAERGCLGYELYRVAGHTERFILDETWLDRDSLDAHGQTDHMIKAAITNQSFRAGKAVASELVLME